MNEFLKSYCPYTETNHHTTSTGSRTGCSFCMTEQIVQNIVDKKFQILDDRFKKLGEVEKIFERIDKFYKETCK